jgi:hypothetical protein
VSAYGLQSTMYGVSQSLFLCTYVHTYDFNCASFSLVAPIPESRHHLIFNCVANAIFRSRFELADQMGQAGFGTKTRLTLRMLIISRDTFGPAIVRRTTSQIWIDLQDPPSHWAAYKLFQLSTDLTVTAQVGLIRLGTATQRP